MKWHQKPWNSVQEGVLLFEMIIISKKLKCGFVLYIFCTVYLYGYINVWSDLGCIYIYFIKLQPIERGIAFEKIVSSLFTQADLWSSG